ncbi:MAG: hypothetical protein ACK4ND_07505 [Cytophagaceae bacterium]
MYINKYFHLFFCFILITFVSSCVPGRTVQVKSYALQSNCHKQNKAPLSSKTYEPVEEIIQDTALLTRFSSSSLHVANAIGLLPMLEKLIKHEYIIDNEPSIEDKVDYLFLKQQILERIELASLEISGTASEMDCEEERADQIAYMLMQKENSQERKLTVAAITVGALIAIASGVIYARNPDSPHVDGVGIIGGVAEVGLGLSILFLNKKVNFSHRRNPLKAFWYNDNEEGIFPSSVWYYLNQKNEGEMSVRQELIQKWISLEQMPAEGDKHYERDLNLYLGEGGRYTAEQLSNRANMLDQLEAQINLMQKELKQLISEIIYR